MMPWSAPRASQARCLWAPTAAAASAVAGTHPKLHRISRPSLCCRSFLVERVRDGRQYALKRTLISELSEAEKWVAGVACRSRRRRGSSLHPRMHAQQPWLRPAHTAQEHA